MFTIYFKSVKDFLKKTSSVVHNEFHDPEDNEQIRDAEEYARHRKNAARYFVRRDDENAEKKLKLLYHPYQGPKRIPFHKRSHSPTIRIQLRKLWLAIMRIESRKEPDTERLEEFILDLQRILLESRMI